MVRSYLVVVMFAAVMLVSAQEPQSIAPGSLTIEEVVRLSSAGVTDELIVANVKKNAKAFDLNSDEIVALKKAGVSETVIKYLLDPSLPYSPPPPPSPGPAGAAEPASKFPYDAIAEKVPMEIGLYYYTAKKDYVPLDLKPIVPQKEPGKLSKMMGGHIIGSAATPEAKVRAPEVPLLFYARLGAKIMIDDLVLLNFQSSKKRRDLDFGSKPGTPVFPPKSVHQFESKEVGPGSLYRISVPALDDDEYIFLILGSGDEKKGLLGRGYDFGVDE
jgi:hypothetical protein